jgi:hypothetical protein
MGQDFLRFCNAIGNLQDMWEFGTSNRVKKNNGHVAHRAKLRFNQHRSGFMKEVRGEW